MGNLKKNSLHIFCFSLCLQKRDKMCSSQEKYSIYIPVGRCTEFLLKLSLFEAYLTKVLSIAAPQGHIVWGTKIKVVDWSCWN